MMCFVADARWAAPGKDAGSAHVWRDGRDRGRSMARCQHGAATQGSSCDELLPPDVTHTLSFVADAHVEARTGLGTRSFADRVADAVEAKRTQLVVGLDPRVD